MCCCGCFCCVLGGSFSCWMEQHDSPPPQSICAFLIFSCAHSDSYRHTHARTHSLRKSCFIYETYSSESHRVLLRFRDCSHTHSHAAGHAFALSAVLARQKHSCFSVTSVFLCSAWMAASWCSPNVALWFWVWQEFSGSCAIIWMSENQKCHPVLRPLWITAAALMKCQARKSHRGTNSRAQRPENDQTMHSAEINMMASR